MSELIDKAVLIANMYSEAFESDTDMQRWDSGCWIRYKLFEKVVDSTPTVPYGPRWHRVEDGLPVKGEIVIVSDGKRTWDVGQYRCLAFSDGDRTKWWWKGHTIKTVKWWMRKKDALPEPPKEDA